MSQSVAAVVAVAVICAVRLTVDLGNSLAGVPSLPPVRRAMPPTINMIKVVIMRKTGRLFCVSALKLMFNFRI